MTNNSSFYNFSDEDEEEDSVLNSSYDRWEQYGRGAKTLLFKFSLRQIGKRREWRNVV